MADRKNMMFKGILWPNMSNVKDRLQFYKLGDQLCRSLNALVEHGEVYILNEFSEWDKVRSAAAAAGTAGVGIGATGAEGGAASTKTVPAGAAVTMAPAAVSKMISDLIAEMDSILSDANDATMPATEPSDAGSGSGSGGDDEESEDEERPKTKGAKQDAYDEKKGFESSIAKKDLEIEKLNAHNEFVTEKVEMVADKITAVKSSLEHALKNVPLMASATAGPTASSAAAATSVQVAPGVYLPRRPTLAQLTLTAKHATNFDLARQALELALGSKHAAMSNDANLDDGVPMVHGSPHKILDRLFGSVSNVSLGVLQHAEQIAHLKFQWVLKNAHMQEVKHNFQAVNKLQDAAQETSADMPDETLKIAIVLGAMEESSSQLHKPHFQSGHTFVQIKK